MPLKIIARKILNNCRITAEVNRRITMPLKIFDRKIRNICRSLKERCPFRCFSGIFWTIFAVSSRGVLTNNRYNKKLLTAFFGTSF